MTRDDEPDDADALGLQNGPIRLQPVPADGVPAKVALSVRLLREFKGLLVKDLLADATLAEQLPGRARSALAHLERGDLAAAERALPGHFATLLPFPRSQRKRERGPSLVVLLLTALAILTVAWFTVGS
ncbi:MAG: hypothetical protein EXS02_00315 [Planctomycetes bacterium]|nr:hypothetical protein [Planctomycetota bacterium]